MHFKVFSGNFDAYSVVSNPLTQPIVARFVRIYAETWQGHAALRLELVGYYKGILQYDDNLKHTQLELLCSG